jgi:uncharacterized protein
MKIVVKLTPNAGKNEIIGWDTSAPEHPVLNVRVTAVPEDGKANKALIALLSKHLKIPKSAIKIIRGETNRLKTIEIPDNFNIHV